MKRYIKEKFSLSDENLRSTIVSICWTIAQDITLFFPYFILYLFLKQEFQPSDENSHSIYFHLGLTAVFIAIMWFVSRKQYVSNFRKVYEIFTDRRIEIAEKLRKLPLSYFERKDLSELSTTIMDDIGRLEETFSHFLPQLYASIAVTIIAFFGLGSMNWMLTFSLFWVIPVAIILFIISRKIIMKRTKKMDRKRLEQTEKIDEGIVNIQEIKSYSQEEEYLEELDATLRDYERSQIRGEFTAGVLLNIIEYLIKLGLPTLILVGTTLLLRGSIDLFTFLFFLIMSTIVYNPIVNLMLFGTALIFHESIFNRVKEIFQFKTQTGSTSFQPNNFDIKFENVDFSYKDDEKIIKNITVDIRQGDVTAIIGPSGSGKTTMLKLIARFWDADRGRILLNGTDINKIDPETLLKYYSIVFQDVIVFNTSVLENIRIGKKDASDEEVLRAAQMAECDEFALRLPNGYHEDIGENGIKLSGGERQRISIARAILKDAPIILLDEATASQDVENENKIQKALSSLIENKTVIIVAHRMRTIANADKIIVLDSGKIREMGSPSELLEKHGEYEKMLRLQMKKDV